MFPDGIQGMNFFLTTMFFILLLWFRPLMFIIGRKLLLLPGDIFFLFFCPRDAYITRDVGAFVRKDKLEAKN